MRAIAIDDFGSAPALRNLPMPEPGPGEVLVRVLSSSLNGFDLSVAAGWLKGMMEHRFPVVLGKDFAGTVETVGAGVSRFAVGDRVFGVVMKPVLGDGAFGEFVTVPESFGISHMPAELNFQAAGALGLAGVAALMAVDAVAPAANETVLVSGATGGVGAFAVQLAAARGAKVIATAKPGDETTFARQMGATQTVDYSGDLAVAVRALYPNGVDAVIHLAGDGVQLSDLLVSGGRIASTLGLSPDQLGDRPVTLTGIMATPDAARLDRLAADVASGQLRVPIQATYPLEEVPQAMKDFRAGTLGKLVVTLD
ncbi:MAG TPA: NADP-dependent oxidoreductase [Symbiobacteriaceae bacterium]|jgi:NADPH:quinone reductase|nr:NADP-dependent oxidoreductase [Symbiobacteriaceae bacterium]